MVVVVDVRLGQRLRSGGHLAIHVEAGGRFEAAQLRAQGVSDVSLTPSPGIQVLADPRVLAELRMLVREFSV